MNLIDNLNIFVRKIRQSIISNWLLLRKCDTTECEQIYKGYSDLCASVMALCMNYTDLLRCLKSYLSHSQY